jgi:hypothetical protein
MRIPPFHSPLRGLALDEVWHDNNECPMARSIAPADRRPGKPSQGSRCAYCAMLDTRPGTPPAAPGQD